MSRTPVRLLLVLLLARLALALLTVEHPEGGILTDSREYLALAGRLVANGQYGVTPDSQGDLIRPPGYALFLTGVRTMLGPGIWKISIVQLAFSGLTSWLILVIGREIGRPQVGLTGAYLHALSPNMTLWSLTVMSEVPFSLSLALVSLLAIRAFKASSPPRLALVGVWLSLSAYVRPIALTLLPAWPALAYMHGRLRMGIRRAATAGAAMASLGVLTALPWIIRNGTTHGQYVFSTATTKTWIGFNLAEVLAQVEGTDRNRAVAELDSQRGPLALTWEVASAHPSTFIKVQLLGVARSLIGTDLGTWGILLGEHDWVGLGVLSGLLREGPSESLAALQRSGAGLSWIAKGLVGWMRLGILAYSLFFTGALLALSALGVIFVRKSEPVERFMQDFGLITVAVLILVPAAAGQARFRVPAEPYLGLFAGYGWGYLRHRMSKRSNTTGATPGELPEILRAAP